MHKPDRKIDLQRAPLYPFLFAFEVILIPLVHNLDQADPVQALKPLGLLMLVTAICLVLFTFLFKERLYAAYLTFLLIIYFGVFSYINRFAQDLVSSFERRLDEPVFLLIISCVICLLANKWVWAHLGGHTWLTSYLNLVIALGLLVPVFQLASQLLDHPLQTVKVPENPTTGAAELSLDCSYRPDIYYIILDGYGRADMLADLYDLDNTAFIDYLQQKGFYVASQSYANYVQTTYSTLSSLNFDYIQLPGEDVNRASYFASLMRRNRIMAALKGCGYLTMAFESGFFFTEHLAVDTFLAHGIGANEFESLLLADSPVEVLAQKLNAEVSEYNYAAHRQRVLYSFKKLGELPRLPGPKFIFAHIVSPHPPFVFDQSGQPVEPQWSYYLGDGDDFQGSLADYLAGYRAQIAFVNQEVQQTVDLILENSSSPPVIILQGDHGPGSRLVWDASQQTCLWERTPILNAYYLPEEGKRLLYPSISPVNTFRLVLNTNFSAHLPYLPDISYFTTYEYDQQAIDITAERSSQANCETP